MNEAGIVRDKRIGSVLSGRYRVLERLGAGGMGEVYEVEHVRLGCRFAAKFLRADPCTERAAIERFEREAQALALLRSQHVASIIDSGQDEHGAPFFVMERLHGRDLKQLLARYQTLTVPRATSIVLDASLGLKAVHAAGLLHGDLKPANLFVCTDDRGADLCKILDFGLARSAAGVPARTTMQAGTVRYLAPEQLVGGGVVDQRTDIRALGAVLYECLAGRPPHVGDKIERVLHSIMHTPPEPLSELGVPVPRELDLVILRALAQDPRDRFATADAFIEAIAPFVGRHPLAQPRPGGDDLTLESRAFQVTLAPKRRAPAAALLAAGALAGAAAVAVPVWLHTKGPRSVEVARRAAPPPTAAPVAAAPPLAPLTASSVVPSAVPVEPQRARVAPSPVASAPAASTPAPVGARDAGRRAVVGRGPVRDLAEPAPRSALIGEFDTTSPYQAGDR